MGWIGNIRSSAYKQMNEKHMMEIDLILGNKPEDWIGYGGAGNRQLRTL